jgi:septal ring factor EnvC (AmiA/AmiB activator)
MQSYGLLVVDIQQKEFKKKMKSYEKAITVEWENQRALRKEIGKLKADMEYQFDTGIAETEAQISLKEDEIRIKEESITLYKEEKKMLKEKLKS